MKNLTIFAVTALLAVFAIFTAVTAHAKSKLVIEGSTTVLPIAQQTAEAFMSINPDADISVRGGGSGVGITSLIEGTCDIADSSRPIKDGELQTAAGKGISPKANVVAMDGIAVIVHAGNPVSHLTKAQLKDIYTGKISDWSKLGGTPGKIVVISRDSASGTFEAFGALALGGSKVRPDALMQASNQAIASIIAKAPGAIGYVGLGYTSELVKILLIDNVVPSKKTVLNGQYPLSRPLFMYTNGKPKGAAKQYIDFVLSAEGQKLVEEAGFIGLK